MMMIVIIRTIEYSLVNNAEVPAPARSTFYLPKRLTYGFFKSIKKEGKHCFQEENTGKANNVWWHDDAACCNFEIVSDSVTRWRGKDWKKYLYLYSRRPDKLSFFAVTHVRQFSHFYPRPMLFSSRSRIANKSPSPPSTCTTFWHCPSLLSSSFQPVQMCFKRENPVIFEYRWLHY